MSITLPAGFQEREDEKMTAHYLKQGFSHRQVKIEKEDFAKNKKIITQSLDAYAQDFAKTKPKPTVENIDGLTCIKYESLVNNKLSHFLTVVFKGSDAFWLVHFSGSGSLDENLPDYISWAQTFTVMPFTLASYTFLKGMSVELPAGFERTKSDINLKDIQNNMNLMLEDLKNNHDYKIVDVNKEYECFELGLIILDVQLERFSSQKGLDKITVGDYAQKMIDTYGWETSVENSEGLTSFICKGGEKRYRYRNPYDLGFSESQIADLESQYFSVVIKGEDAFWFIQFSTVPSDFDEMLPSFIAWAKTVHCGEAGPAPQKLQRKE
ncbi:MAG: hypothetical protein FWG14_03025 [Peptococcaceae bacterium]|nr:hypothetical protein [Peptococcaceae bacterium]